MDINLDHLVEGIMSIEERGRAIAVPDTGGQRANARFLKTFEGRDLGSISSAEMKDMIYAEYYPEIEKVIARSEELLSLYDSIVLGGYDPEISKNYYVNRFHCFSCQMGVDPELSIDHNLIYSLRVYDDADPDQRQTFSPEEIFEKVRGLSPEDAEAFYYKLRSFFVSELKFKSMFKKYLGTSLVELRAESKKAEADPEEQALMEECDEYLPGATEWFGEESSNKSYFIRKIQETINMYLFMVELVKIKSD